MNLTKKIIFGFICLTLMIGLIAGCGGDDDPVNPDNTAPVAVADGYNVHTDSILTVAAPGVLANDTDADDDALTAVIVGNPSNGVLALNANGSFTYDADADFVGVDTFTYRANDGTENSNTVNVIITVQSPTTITGGTIDTDSTWALLYSPYTITGDLYIEAAGNGATLTIEPGVEVRLNENIEILVSYTNSEYGAIIAEGTQANPITFTSSAAIPDAGDWERIHFYQGTLPTTKFNHCIFEYGGSNLSYGMIYIRGCAVAIDNSTIRYSGTYGVDLHEDGEFSSFTGNKLYANDAAPIRIKANYAHTIGVIDSIATDYGIIVEYDKYEQTNETWLAHDVPYTITGDVYVGKTGISGATLNIEAGATLKFEENIEMLVSYTDDENGAIIANGTVDNPITFTSANPIPAAGDWERIDFYEGTLPTTKFNHCIFEYGGSNLSYGMIYIRGCAVAIDNSTIRYSGTYGVDLHEDGEFSSFTGNKLYANDAAPIRIKANYAHTIGVIDSIATDYGIIVEYDDYVQTNETWLAHDVPYTITGDVYIGKTGTGATLTIEPGTILKFDSGVKFRIGYNASDFGALIAEGTTTNSITFTSSSPSPGHGAWSGIWFDDGAMNTSSMEYCKVLYGGSASYGNIVCSGIDAANTPTLANCEIAYSAGYGIYVYDCTPDYTGIDMNDVHDNDAGDIYVGP
ncbi:MAG: cadherin-like domain-containing protein [candidate division Zixibacteria bacterium]|nr:cadherin-like domain-containing protein [candidate division Zixibacteria bacterium]